MQVVIFSSPSRLSMLKNLLTELKGFDVEVINDFKTFGKENFYKRWQKARVICLKSKQRDFLIIPDDVSDLDLQEIKKVFELNKERPFTCNLINDGRHLPCWSSLERPIFNFETENYKYQDLGYFDCGGLINREALRKVRIDQPPDYWFDRPNKSSGVGYQLTKQLRENHVSQYTPSPTLANHGNHESVMHYHERKVTPLVSQRKMKKVCAIATMPGRELFLENTLKSLEGQFDEIHVYDNGKEKIDLTDNGKFYFLQFQKRPCYYFSCDDDIIYPKTYAKDLIQEIERTKSIVTLHGRKLGLKCNTYYRNPSNICFHCKSEQTNREVLDVAGTGVTAFRTDYFNPAEIYKIKHKRMADLVFSLEAKEQGKQIVLMPHKENYLKVQNVPEENTIFGQETNKRDIEQSQLQNKIIMAKSVKTTKTAPTYANKMETVYIVNSHHKKGYVAGLKYEVSPAEKQRLLELEMIEDVKSPAKK